MKSNSILSGSSFILIAKIYWLLIGYVLVLTLPRLVSVETYGIWGVVIGIISVLNMVVIMGTNQGVSKFVSADEINANAIRTTSHKIILFIGFGISITFFLCSKLIADFLNDPSLVLYFQIAVFITLFYSFYAVNVGYLNGLRRFKHQALLDIIFVTLKVILILGFGYFEIFYLNGNGLKGAISGFALAALIILFISFYFTGFKFDFSKIGIKLSKIIRYIFGLMIFALILNLLMSVDLFFVKKLISTDVITANLESGYYTAAITVSRIPYSLMMTVSIIIFPLISKVTSLNDQESTKTYITNALRLSFILLVAIGGIISFNSTEIISFILGAKYIQGGESLSILAFNVVFLSLFTISCYIIAGAGRPIIPILFGTISLILDVILNNILIPIYGLKGAALSALFSISIGFFISQIFIYRNYRAAISFLTIIKSSVALIVVFFISKYIGLSNGIYIVLKVFLLFIIYFILLIIFKEIKKNDIQLMTHSIGKSKKGS
jgi:stage V sporulation protein B